MSPSAKNKELSYEAAFAELESIVATLEGEGHPLEESLQLYERGQVLAAHCASLLEKAELKIRQLTPAEATDQERQD